MKRGRKPKKNAAILTDGREAGTLMLRDGSRLRFSRALPEDSAQIQAFLNRLTDSEQLQFGRSLHLDREALPAFLDTLADRDQGGAFLVQGERDERVLAFGVYKLLGGLKDAAGLSLAVSPDLRNLGVGTLLIERLAVLAVRSGIARLVGVSEGDAEPLIGLFRSSGFEPDVKPGRSSTSFLISTRAALKAPGSGRRTSSRTFVASSLRPLFHPRSVAVLGDFGSKSEFGLKILWNLVEHGFNGPVFPVNPGIEHALSIRAHTSVTAIGETVDLAVIAVPADDVPRAIGDCAAAGVQAAIVISSGYSEIGAEGKVRERDLLSLVERHGIRMVGPNCMGLIRTNDEVRLNASFAQVMPPRGRAALCSHSGALGIAITALCHRLGLGLSTFVSVGNRTDVSGNDLLEFWEEDEATQVILLYLESFGNPRRFARLARRIGRRKPIVTVKAGRSAAGRRAAVGPGDLVAVNTAIDALLEQTGVISADTIDEMFDIAIALTEQPLPRGRRVAVVTDAGGPAILCVDALERMGLRVEPFSEATKNTLRATLPDDVQIRNPVDMLSRCGPDCYRSAVETVLCADEVDAVVVIHTPVVDVRTEDVGTAIADAVAAARNRTGTTDKPVFASMVGIEEIHPVVATKQGERIPVYFFPEAIGRLLGKLAAYADWQRADAGVFPEYRDQELPRVIRICEAALDDREGGWLCHDETQSVLEAAGLPVTGGRIAASSDAATTIAGEIGFPVALKTVGGNLANRLETGGLRLGLNDPEAVRCAWQEMNLSFADDLESGRASGILVQRSITGTAEVRVQVKDDPRFGPLVTLGLGGHIVEVLGDVARRVSPLTDVDAGSMIRQLRGFPLLEGFRGYPEADVAAIEDLLLRVSRLVEAVPHILQIDLAPIFAFAPGEGLEIADARIRVG